MKEFIVDSTVENIDYVIDTVSEELEKYDCSMKVQTQINIAIDEMFGNIVRYAYVPNVGKIEVKIDIDESRMLSLTFIDSGIPYNPLLKEDPDITLSAQDREIGGLGIFLVKKTMDDLIYSFEDGKNILTIKKQI